MRTTLYDLLVTLLRVATHTFFRNIEVVGLEHVPAEGPVVFLGNHPNSLMDPVLITTTCGRRVRFAAKDTLFESAAFRFLAGILGAVPIKRRQDHSGQTQGALDNSDAFRALFDVLREGDAFGIFPEGISHTGSELAPLKTGAARIALGARAEGVPVVVVPCGLTYKRRTRLRSQVLVQFGEPLAISDETVNAFADDGKATARATTERFDLALRALTINAENFETLRVLDGVRRLYAPVERRLSLAERAEISRRLVDHYARYREVPEVAELYKDIEAYQFKLSALGLHDRDLTKPLSKRAWARKLLGHFFLMAVLLPLALPGVIVHAPILVAAIIAGDAMTRRKDVVATTKLATSLALTLGAYGFIVAGAVYLLGLPTGLYYGPLVVALLLLSGWAMIRVLERQSIARKGFAVFLLLVDLKQQVRELRDLREALRGRTLLVIDRFIDPELERVIAPT